MHTNIYEKCGGKKLRSVRSPHLAVGILLSIVAIGITRNIDTASFLDEILDLIFQKVRGKFNLLFTV